MEEEYEPSAETSFQISKLFSCGAALYCPNVASKELKLVTVFETESALPSAAKPIKASKAQPKNTETTT